MAKIRSIAKKIKNSPKTIKKVREIAERQLEREKEEKLGRGRKEISNTSKCRRLYLWSAHRRASRI